ncbi:MAG: MFS transporter [Acidimicrobiales bacterium]
MTEGRDGRRYLLVFTSSYALFRHARLLLFVVVWYVYYIGYYIGNYAWLTLAPTLLVSKGFSLVSSISFLVVPGLGFIAGAVASTRVADRFERKMTILVVSAVWGIVLFIVGAFASPAVIMIGGFAASGTIGLMAPMMYALTAEHFSTASRATGVALTGGLGHLGGAMAPLFVLGANAAWGFAAAFDVMAVTGPVTAILLPLSIRATRRSLEAVTT